MNLLVVLILGISLISGIAEASKCRFHYRVKAGDSLWKIAKKYGVSVKDLRGANPKLRASGYIIKPGDKLCIPVKKKAVVNKKAVKKKKRYITYTVKKGDSLWKIARKFGVSQEDIKRANRLRNNKLIVGQKLKIPVKGYTKRTKKKYTKRYRKSHEIVYIRYKVRKGDSLIKVAKKFGVDWRTIKKVNRLRGNLIRVGQVLKIPVPKRSFERRYTRKPRINLSFLPVKGTIRKSPNGVDIYAPCGEDIRVIDSGKVVYSGDDLVSYGNTIIVKHKDFISVYAYNDENIVESGESVEKGEVIGKVGVKPGSGKCALHFEIRTKNGSVLDPLEYIGRK